MILSLLVLFLLVSFLLVLFPLVLFPLVPFPLVLFLPVKGLVGQCYETLLWHSVAEGRKVKAHHSPLLRIGLFIVEFDLWKTWCTSSMVGLEDRSGVQQDSSIFHTSSDNHLVAASFPGRNGRLPPVIATVNGPPPVTPTYGLISTRTW